MIDDKKMQYNIFNEEDVYTILDAINIGIWVIEYNEVNNIRRMYANPTLLKIMGIKDKLFMPPDECYDYWYARVDKYYIDDVEACLENLISMYHQENKDLVIADEVNYLWWRNNDECIHARAGGKVIENVNGTYIMYGYFQDYTNVLEFKNIIRARKESQLLKEKLKDSDSLKLYYKKLAYVDELTGLVNRRGLQDNFAKIVAGRMRRKNDYMWLAILDLDFFKSINDKYGHLNGDKVLKFIGKELRKLSGNSKDVHTFRYGGEEFIILICRRTKQEVEVLLNNCRELIKQECIKVEANNFIHITCSIGVASIKKTQDFEAQKDLKYGILRADKALYEAKQMGRDRVIFE